MAAPLTQPCPVQVTTVPQDFGLMDETWYVHTASVETAKSTLSGMAPGLFVIVPDEQGGLNYYTMVSVTRRGCEPRPLLMLD